MPGFMLPSLIENGVFRCDVTIRYVINVCL